MASADSPTITASPVPIATAAPLISEEEAARAVRKRYETLAAVRSRAIKGKGAWYWAHLEPVVYHHPSTGRPKLVKLRCSLCSTEFSASNPSRTASEHLKRGTCPYFTSSAPPSAIAAASPPSPKPVSSFPPPSLHQTRKRTPLHPDPAAGGGGGGGGGGYPLAMVDYPTPRLRQPDGLVLSGGKDDLEALAMLENNVKRLKSPKATPCPALGKEQIELAMTHFADWVYECCGGVSFSSLDHPKLRAFLQQVGLPVFSSGDLAGARLTARYEEVLQESEARIRDAPFFQISSDGWEPVGEDGVVAIVLNLPNGTSVFHKAVFVNRKVQYRFAEELLWDTITRACGGELRRCAGVVSTKFKLKVLREIERRSPWMVNLPCQLKAVSCLLKDFVRELPLLRLVAGKCRSIAHFFTTNPRARNCLQEYTLREQLDHFGMLPATFGQLPISGYSAVVELMEDVMAQARELHQIVVDESESSAFPPEVAKTILDVGFWNELEAALSLVKLTREMAEEIEAERPFVGQCLPMWEELKLKLRSWCVKYEINDGPVNELIDRRFRKNYHPAWAAAFVLDPLYLLKDANGRYLPPFKCLTPEQAADVDGLISRLVSPEEAHVALVELLKWRSEGLERDYALAVQVKRRDPATGKMRIANPLGGRLVWESHLRDFKPLGKVAVRLIFLHATACRFKCGTSFLRWVGCRRRSPARLDAAQKMVFVAGNEKLKRMDLSSEEEKDAKLFSGIDDDASEDDFGETAAL